MIARFAWHADSYDRRLASIRYRLLAPLDALRRQGVAIEQYQAGRDYAAIIFSKSHSPAAVAAARRARAGGHEVIFDLCDNLFAAQRAGHASGARVARLREMLGLATHLTFSTATLAEQIAEEVPGLRAPTSVIPDVLDIDPPAALPLSLRDQVALASLRRFHARHAGALHCVWFGKSLGQASGYAHVGAAARELGRFAHPTTLTIVSNDWLGYRGARRRWPVPVTYVPWTLASAAIALARHRVAVIPLEQNDYTAGKTINRPATALLAGLGVVADALPSYEELRPFIALDDWQGGLERYRQWSDETAAALAAGRAHLAAAYGADAVAARWRAILEAL